MSNEQNLKRFLDAQETDYAIALSEIKSGKKRSHWMWYIFPQIQGLGLSSTSQYYAIKNLQEAKAYLQHPVLGKRLIEISSVLLTLGNNDAHNIFGSPDDMKLKSCMTLFSSIENTSPVFKQILDLFFGGEADQKTINVLNKAH
ncbi:DUF1810 domain-containing protein [Mucilaginibacter sp. PAMB04274]|uniref:DUF1810 domain-containing protein n=1 Tax=Mucilaginibacter sp. PAMB04274 TaxID=3138568 RepID=UPI0031F5FF1C